jgi:hypothetical protein
MDYSDLYALAPVSDSGPNDVSSVHELELPDLLRIRPKPQPSDSWKPDTVGYFAPVPL